ncbi:MAG: amidase [Thermoleophilaceae bacterium]|jgi:amidase|nr:amidase [Thermoleophilaceae bacterium]
MDATELAYAGIARQAELIRSREVSPLELVDVCLERIERLDPQLNAFRTVYGERARAEAQQAEGRLGAGEERPLLGVPVAIKDNIEVAGDVTTDGSAAYGEPAQSDAEMVRRLREAGAIVIGKTHLPELAIWPATESDAWGITRNPWDTSRTPGGSSGGSAAAVAAGLAGAGLATDGGGSIRLPAACCGLVGLKTQRGRVSLSPHTEHWNGLSVAGSVTRHTIDTALWLDVVAGGNPAVPEPERPFVDSARSAPGRLRIAVSTKSPDPRARTTDPVRSAIDEMADVLRSLGHDVQERDPDYGWLLPLFLPRWAYGITEDVEASPHPEALEPRTRRLAGLGRAIGTRGVRWARDREEGRARRINAVFDHADVLLTPTMPAPPIEAGFFARAGLARSIDRASGVTPFTIPWNVTGQPAAAVPTPSSDKRGVPLSAQLIGRPNDEPTLISLAAQLEAEIGWPARRPPVG